MIGRRAEGGFTLIEMMTSVSVFAVMTIGIVPLLASSITGAASSRAATVAKNFAVQTMERVRGLPYFVSYSAQNQRVDVLDLYFPDLAAPNYNSTTGEYTTTCDPAPGNPACPRNIPDGYTASFAIRFVAPASGGGLTTVYPESDYEWDSLVEADFPPSQLTEMALTISWVFGGDNKTYTLRSLIGDRKILGDSVRGSARVDYGIEVVTNFVDDTVETQLTATAGTTESLIESRLVSSAEQFTRAGRLRLVEVQAEGSEIPAQDIPPILDGATSDHSAPPDATPVAASATNQVKTHPTLGFDIAGLDATFTSGLEVAVGSELPVATGGFGFEIGAGEAAGGEADENSDFWVMNQADTGENAELRLNPLSKLLSVKASGNTTLVGDSSAITTPTSTPSTREVETSARIDFEQMNLFTALIPTLPEEVIQITNFDAEVICTATPTATPAATATWSATLSYFEDTDPADNVASGGHVAIALGDTHTSDPLATLGPESELQPDGVTPKENPLVYDGLTSLTDIYLFDDPVNSKNGYLKTWNSNFGQEAAVTEGGQVAKAGINGAIFIHTAPTRSDLPNSGLKVSVGKLSCDAMDKR